MQHLDQLIITGCSSIQETIIKFLGFGTSLALEQKCLGAHTYAKQNPTVVMGVSAFIFIGVIATFFSKKTSGVKVFQATLLNVKEITHDTKIFTFDLPEGWDRIGLNIGEHLTLTAQIDGKVEDRKYTPISRADVKRNSFELLIKVYTLGKMSSYVNKMKLGDKIKVSLPYGRFNYLGKQISQNKISVFQFIDRNNSVKAQRYDHLFLIGGGTGITPLYQIIQYVTEVEAPNGPQITLLFANRTESDILLKPEIEAFQKANPKFKCYFSVDRNENEGWTGFTGFIDEEKLKKIVPADTKGVLFAACGPPPMVNLVEKLLVTKFNVQANRFFRF